jgi:uncharacterized protein YgbK (DUF1537 family)
VGLLESGEGNVLAFGGETLQAFARRARVAQLEALAELMPGAALMLAHGDCRTMLVAGKSGGFGSQTFLEEFMQCCWE